MLKIKESHPKALLSGGTLLFLKELSALDKSQSLYYNKRAQKLKIKLKSRCRPVGTVFERIRWMKKREKRWGSNKAREGA